MKALKLSLALACLLALAAPSSARAQDHDTGIVPASAGGSQAPDSAFPKAGTVSLEITTPALPGREGSARTLNVNLETGAYTVIRHPTAAPGGFGSHMETLESMGTLSKAQVKALKGQLDDLKSAKPPAKMPGAPVMGAGTFTLSWDQGAGGKGSTSGPDNAKGATSGQSKKVKAVWDAVSPLLDKMSSLQTKLVQDHPYQPVIETVEGSKKAPKTVDLGQLNQPGTEFEKAAAAKGLVADGGLFLQPGQKITFESDRNQIYGLASLESNNPDVKVTSEIVKPMHKGQLGDVQTVKWTIELSPKAGSATTAELTGTADYQSRHDPGYNFKIGVAAKPTLGADDGMAPPSKGKSFNEIATEAAAKAAAAAGTTVEGGVSDAIKARGQTEKRAPETGMGQLLDKRLNDAKDGDAKKAEDR